MSEMDCKETGKASMMRKITFILVISGVSMYVLELIFCMVMAKYLVDYDAHETFTLGLIGLGVAGKVSQKFAEVKNK